MESIKVQTEDLRKAAANVDRLAIDYGDKYVALLKDVDDLTKTDYVGPAGEAYKNQIEGFREDFNKMKELMQEYADYLRQTAAIYDDVTTKQINQIKSMQN